MYSFDPSEDIRHGRQRHGPAMSKGKAKFLHASDRVCALQCRSRPACVSEWLTRRRPFNCPSPEQVDICKAFGCLFVPVSPPNSDEQDLL